MVRKQDIPIIDKVLSLVSDKGCILFDEVYKISADEAQAERIIAVICSYNAARKTDIDLVKTDGTAMLIADGGANYIYEQTQRLLKRKALELEDLQLSVWEKKRNKWLSIAAIIISILSIIMTIILGLK